MPLSTADRGRSGRTTRRPAGLAVGVLVVLVALLTGTAPASAAPSPVSPPSAASIRDGSWWYEAMHMEREHRLSTGKGVTIALLDSPVDRGAAELRGQRVQAGGSYCDGLSSPFGSGRAVFHGTSMAVLLVGSGHGTRPGGSGVRGIAPDATLRVYAINTGVKDETLSCDHIRQPQLGGVQDSVVRAFHAAVDDGADIISVSFSCGCLNPVDIQYALAKGVVVVAAIAGRYDPIYGLQPDNVLGSPAVLSGVVSVTAIDATGHLMKDLNNGDALMVAAPGVQVDSGSIDTHGRWSSDGLGSGTSPATAITAGALALVKSRYPTVTAAQLVQHLVRTTEAHLAKHDNYFGFGTIALTRMLATSPLDLPDDDPFLSTAAAFVDVRRLQATKQHPAPAADYPEVLYGHVPPPPGFVFPPGLPLHKGKASATPPAPTAAPAAPAAGGAAKAATPRSGTAGPGGLTSAVGALAAFVLAGVAALAVRRRRRDSATRQP